MKNIFFNYYFKTVQLLHKMSIKAVGTSTALLKVIKNPITSHLPFCRKVLMSYQAPKLSKPAELVPDDKSPLVVVIGAMAHGQVIIKILEYKLIVNPK